MSAAPNILVVDDEPPILELVRGYLEREGFSVRTVEDGLAAVEQVRAEQPDLVVLDPTQPLDEIVGALNHFHPDSLIGYASILRTMTRRRPDQAASDRTLPNP